MKWLLIFAVYQAPAEAIDWDGPWTIGFTKIVEEQFDSEAACRTSAIQTIGQIHQGMLAPIRYRCVAIESTLPKGASR